MVPLFMMNACRIAIALFFVAPVAHAQALQFFPVNSNTELVNTAYQSAVYAAAHNDGVSRTRFAVYAVTARGLSPSSTLFAFEGGAPAVMTGRPLASDSGHDVVGLQALPGRGVPLIAVLRGQRGFANQFSIDFPLAPNVQPPRALTSNVVLLGDPELGCDRLGNYCALITGHADQLYSERFRPIGAANIQPPTPVPTFGAGAARWDLDYESVGAVVAGETGPEATPTVQVASLPPGLDAREMGALRTDTTQLLVSRPRIACRPQGDGDSCLLLFTTPTGVLRVKNAGGNGPVVNGNIHGLVNVEDRLMPGAYDITRTSLGFRVAYFARRMNILRLMVRELLGDGSALSTVQVASFFSVSDDVRGVRITPAIDAQTSLVTWVHGTEGAARSCGMVLRGNLLPESVNSPDAGAEGGVVLDSGIVEDTGVLPDIPTATDVPTNGPSLDGSLVVADASSPLMPPKNAISFGGGACGCRTTPSHRQTHDRKWLGVFTLLASLAVHTSRRGSRKHTVDPARSSV